jgi:dTDP-4-dehydrorhamnose reductase
MRLLVTGASGQLGSYLLRGLVAGGTPVTAWSGSRAGTLFNVPLWRVDLADATRTAAAFRVARPRAVIHAAALSSVADCHRDPGRAHAVNTAGTALLAELAARAGARLVYVSTDLVFDGEQSWYREEDAPRPLSVYGRSKAAAEEAVRAVPRGLVARVSLLFGPTLTGRPSFFDQQAAALRERRPLKLFEDEWRTPLSLLTAARSLAALAASDVCGTLHLGGPERLNRLEMGQRLAEFLGLDASVLVPARRGDVRAPEPRPRDTSLLSTRWRELFPHLPWPEWREALRQMKAGW